MLLTPSVLFHSVNRLDSASNGLLQKNVVKATYLCAATFPKPCRVLPWGCLLRGRMALPNPLVVVRVRAVYDPTFFAGRGVAS